MFSKSKKPGKKSSSFWAAEEGTTLVEFAICIALFLLILFGILDFGRLGYQWVVTEKAIQRAARVATVRPPVCPDVPEFHERQDNEDRTYNTGTLCRDVDGLCKKIDPNVCLLSEPTTGPAFSARQDIWNALKDLMPPDTDEDNILISYEYDRRLGFLGGPYVPVVSIELVGSYNDGTKLPLMFEFVTPLSELAAVAGAANASTTLPDGTAYGEDCSGCIPFPRVSVTLPGEDLNNGMGG